LILFPRNFISYLNNFKLIKKMKKIFKYLLTISMLGIAVSCGTDFLDKKPIGPVSEDTLAANEKGADALLISAYSLMDGFGGWDLGTPWGGTVTNWSFGSIAGGDAYKGSEANDQPDITPIERHDVTPLSPYIESKWNNLFNGISRANKAINIFKALKTVSSETYRTGRIAEAKYLRALYYMELKRMWNNIPYIDETVTEFRVPNDKDIWPNITKDAQDAAAGLPASQADIGRATKWTATALLGKILIYQKKFAEAETAFDAVINSKAYKLMDKYGDNFNPEFRNNSEGVIVVQQSVNDGTTDNGNNGDVLNFPYNGGPGGCCGFHQPSQNLVNAFKTTNGLPLVDTYNSSDVKSDQGLAPTAAFTPTTEELDARIDWTVGRRGIPYLDWGNHPGQAWIRDQTYAGPYSPKKNVYYKNQENINTSASGWTKGFTNNNYKILRYADVILMDAECKVETNKLEEARALVNQIRKRAANPDGFVKDASKPAANYVVKEYATAWTVQGDARKAVRHERRIELGMEGHRFFDLVRWGVAAAEKNAYFDSESKKRTYLIGSKFTAGKSEYYPIPAKAITLSALDGKNTLTQNPGY
jgi:starch-binding outer membrane protein, SusD/RagB family